MNEFIKLRESISKYENNYDFSKLLLEKLMNNKKDLNDEEKFFLTMINDIGLIKNTKQAETDKLIQLMSFLGKNMYIDRYIMNTIISVYKDEPRELLNKTLNDEIKKADNNKLYHFLDLILEFNFKILSKESILVLIDKYQSDFDMLTLLFECLDQFNLEISKDYLYQELKKDYPNTIKIQILSVLDNLYSITNLDVGKINSSFHTEKDLEFVNDYIKFLNGSFEIEDKETVILQSMFYGDFEDSGKGNNGGLAILLRGLGNEVSLDKRVDLVITITISDGMKKPFMVFYEDNHVFVRLPAYLNRNVPDPFLKRELYIKRYINKYLRKLNVSPDIYHIRYLDNASMAVAKLSDELNKKLVLTLAPDPHRNMVDEEGVLRDFEFAEVQVLLNKIKIGDKLIFKSDKILGIGGRKVNKELGLYFPQFHYPEIKDKIKMIAEGIKTDDDMFKKSEDVDVCELNELIGIDPSFCDKPIILNVGRLAKLKGQVALFKAWSRSKLHESHNLLMIGGDLEEPNQDEKEVIDFFKEELKNNPQLKDKFYHKSALPNDEIKTVEKSIMKKRFNYPHIYIASSLKEEFGIAILEAMSRGFLVMAPIKGGVKSYITNGENGFLIDTSSFKTIAEEAENILYKSKMNTEKFQKIQDNGTTTVKEEFSIDKIARTFADTYMSLLKGEKDEV